MLATAIWLGIMAWQDARKKEVSNWLTVPPVFVVAGWRAWQGEWSMLVLLLVLIAITETMDRLNLSPAVAYAIIPIVVGTMGCWATQQSVLVLVTWSVIWMGWMGNLFGEADAKVLMALIGLWPDRWMVGFLLAGQVLWSTYHLVQRYRSGALQVVIANAVVRPTEQDLETQGVPTIPAYAAAGLGYFALAMIGVF
jgi:Flp pilus assembly protein protease CpaA